MGNEKQSKMESDFGGKNEYETEHAENRRETRIIDENWRGNGTAKNGRGIRTGDIK